MLLSYSEEMDILFTVPGSARKKRQRTLEIIRGERQDGRLGNQAAVADKPMTQTTEDGKTRDAESIV